MSGQLANLKIKDESRLIQSIRAYLVYIILASVFLLPSVAIFSGMPEIRLEDFLLPVVACLLVIEGRGWKDRLIITSLIFSLYILFTMLVNGRLTQYRDYFEIYKMLKFILFYVLFLEIDWNGKRVKILAPIFIVVCLFNIMQYFNVLNFNKIIEPFYAGDIQLDSFGLNSLGLPGTKRLLGTMGNPNNNAVLWMFFTCLFFTDKSRLKWTHFALFLTAFVGMLACQSRTTFISFIVVFAFSLIARNETAKQKLILSGLVLTVFVLFYLTVDAHYIGSLSGAEVLKTHSVRGRLEVWTLLFKMMLHKPFFGYAPFKEYFYNNNLYVESEYVLMAWRYGLVGMAIFFSWLLFPIRDGWKNRGYYPVFNQLLFVVVLVINGLTNTPFQEPGILVTFALSCAIIARFKKNPPVNAQVIVSRE